MEKTKKCTLMGYVLEKKKLFAVFVISTLVLSVVAPVKSYIMQWLIDAPSKTAAIRYLMIGMGIIIISHISEYFSRISFMKIACKSIEQIRNQLIAGQIRKPMKEYMAEKTGDVLSLLTNDMRLIFDDYYMSLFNMAMWGGMMLVALIMLAFISPALLAIALVLGMAPLLAPKLLAEKMAKLRGEYSTDIASYTAKTGELLKGFEALAASGAFSYFTKVHEKAAASNREKEHRLQWMLHVSSVISSLVSWIPSITVLLFGVFLVYDGKISIGYLVTANMLTNFVISPCRQVSDSYAKWRASLSIKNRIEAALRQNLEETGSDLEEEVENIRIRNLTFTYPGMELPALRDISVSFPSHSKVVLVGASGSGKSTIAKVLYGYFDSYEGEVLINDRNLRDIRRESYYKKVAMIPQMPFLFSDTIYNNLCLYDQYSEEEVKRAVELAGLTEFIKDQQDGLNTALSESGRNLSGGQAQRIAIARALLRKCDVMLVDEATASLDAATTSEVIENLLALDCAVILITHDIFGDYMKKFDMVYYLEEGQIKEQGGFEELLERGGSFSQLYHHTKS